MTGRGHEVKTRSILCEHKLDGRPCAQPAVILDPARGMIPLCSDHRTLPEEEAILPIVRRSEAESERHRDGQARH